MKRGAALIITAVIVLLICARCSSRETGSKAELQALFQSRDYFTLRERLQSASGSNSPDILYYNAAVKGAFNRPEASNRQLDQILGMTDIPDSLRADCWTMKMENFMRLHDYEPAARAADSVLHLPNLPRDKEKDVRNTRLIVRALHGVPPQTIEEQGDSKLTLRGTHIDVMIHGHRRDYAYDTGANYSILMESEARDLGLRIIQAGFDVGTATGQTVKGDLGIADSLTIGHAILRHVVFLVFPDEALTFPGGFQLRGVIGFPVLEALGELQFSKGTIFIPEDPPARDIHNLALENLTPLVQFTYRGNKLIGRFDTGASRTEFYEPFFQRYFADTVTPDEIDTVKTGGLGGNVKHPVYQANVIPFRLAGREVTLDSVQIHTRVLGDGSENYLFANIGLDVLRRFDQYILNFRDMAFILQ